MIHVVIDYQVHVSTKHREERRAQQSRLMGTSDYVVWIFVIVFKNLTIDAD